MNAEPQTSPRKMNLTQFFVDKSDTFDRDTGWCESLNVQRIHTSRCKLDHKKRLFLMNILLSLVHMNIPSSFPCLKT